MIQYARQPNHFPVTSVALSHVIHASNVSCSGISVIIYAADLIEGSKICYHWLV